MLATVCLGGCGASLNDLSSTPSSTTLAQAGLGEDKTTPERPIGSAAKASQKFDTQVAKTSEADPGASATKSRAASQQKITADTLAAMGTPGSVAYLIGPQDLIEITVFKVPDLSKVVQVSETGTINLPLLGSVQASGRTAQQLEKELTQALGSKYLQQPQLNVIVKEYNSQRVTLEGGGIKKPGVYPLRGKMSLLQLIATADGLSDISDSQVAIFRQKGTKRAAVRFDVSAIRTGEIDDPPLQPGDVIVATSSASKEAFNNVLKALPLATILRPF